MGRQCSDKMEGELKMHVATGGCKDATYTRLQRPIYRRWHILGKAGGIWGLVYSAA